MLHGRNEKFVFPLFFVKSYRNTETFVSVIESVPIDRFPARRNVLGVFIGQHLCHPCHCPFKEVFCGRFKIGVAFDAVERGNQQSVPERNLCREDVNKDGTQDDVNIVSRHKTIVPESPRAASAAERNLRVACQLALLPGSFAALHFRLFLRNLTIAALFVSATMNRHENRPLDRL